MYYSAQFREQCLFQLNPPRPVGDTKLQILRCQAGGNELTDHWCNQTRRAADDIGCRAVISFKDGTIQRMTCKAKVNQRFQE
ncbi:predicted protein [Chaetomium globosum CBS 148.51]|uniref:Uncharacterized protein n=1 Tax=Chaetomium globosum (strain ATCC 6205 / CBS 148.51 / DSM 1962 / NBRC 6347 / NRRL 1970) TaxID=306901 RepID=Q2GWJ8_CHAGB|nr:uncharacterized protein CHGG_07656 [Chaetomium globosum CBS 148.51]EAQ86403.1 predicted protein [Chaetomium globosum CBS 148.51]